MAGDEAESGFRAAELREVTTTGLALADYSVVRSIGAAHHEVMEAHVLGVNLRVYAVFRIEHTHRQALDEAGARDSPTETSATRAGVKPDELAQVRATHAVAVQAYWERLLSDPDGRHDPVRLTKTGDYVVARRAGVPHDEALAFAMQAAALQPRPNMRDLMLWARCRAAGLAPDLLFGQSPRSRKQRLVGEQVDLLNAVLFAVRSYELPCPEPEELMWVASFGGTRRLDARTYLQARSDGRSRRGALRIAARPV